MISRTTKQTQRDQIVRMRKKTKRARSSSLVSRARTNTSSGVCELVECEADFGNEKGQTTQAKINGREINAQALRALKVMDVNGDIVRLPLTDEGKDVVVYLRHLG
jgi:hypothetical protein